MARASHKLNVDSAKLLISISAPRELPEKTRFELAVLGRSNVGKSSLINNLLGRQRLAHTSRTPGRTRLANYYAVGVRRGARRAELHLVDLPGYGYAKISQSERKRLQILLQAYLVKSQRAGLSLLLIDGRRAEASDLDLEIFSGMQQQGREPVIVLTKMDHIAKSKQVGVLRKIQAQLGAQLVVMSSAHKGQGREQLWDLIWPRVVGIVSDEVAQQDNSAPKINRDDDDKDIPEDGFAEDFSDALGAGQTEDWD